MMDISALELRDYIMLAAMLVGVYLGLLLLRLLRLGRQRHLAQVSAQAEGGAPGVPDFVAASDSGSEPHREEPQSAPVGWPSPTVRDSRENPSTSDTPDFARELARSSIDLEVQRLRHEAEQLRAEMTHLAEEMRHLKTTRNVAPLYSEAMTLAQQGVPISGIADRCGISIGEAELVAALARRETGVEFRDKEDDRYPDSGN